ncbi:alpha/beta fold hydrolase [Actinoplanes sp. NPDC051475]|uniref:alpha/beta fold hydrolase n=1 Tax=Actinoplanes sp. NPDC051475 TaxID=3157225 RepID=UPI00344FCBB8
MTLSKALPVPIRQPDAPTMTIAIGPGGAGAAAWKPVAVALGPVTELYAVRLPGRENRFRDPLLRSVAEQSAHIVDHLTELLARDPRPYRLVGVCSGAIVAFEAALMLQRTDRPPAALVAICQEAPWELGTEPSTYDLEPEQFRNWVLRETWVGSTAAANPAALDLFEPTLRADCEAADTYRYNAEGGALTIPLVTITTDRDPLVPPGAAKAWAKGANGGHLALTVPGDHHLLMSDPAALAGALREVIVCEGDSSMDMVERLRAIWEEQLGFAVTGEDDDFFDLGGDSLMALEIAKQAREQGIAMSPGALLDHTTLRELAAAVTDA